MAELRPLKSASSTSYSSTGHKHDRHDLDHEPGHQKEDDNSFDGGKSTYGVFTALAVMINYLIGSGVFGLPYAFYLSGLPIALFCVAIFSTMSTLCALWIPEVMGRANGVLTLESNYDQISQGEKGLTEDEASKIGSAVNIITYRKLDLSLVSNIFGGRPMQAFTQTAMLCYVYTVLWSYAAAWASSVDTLFFQYLLGQECNVFGNNPSPACLVGYYGSLLVFGIFVIIVSLMDVSEQAGLQRIMTGYRGVAFLLMIFSVVIALFYPNPFDPDASEGIIHVSDLNLLKWAGFGTMFSFTAVSFNVQYNLPDVIQPVRASEKKGISRVLVLGMMIATGFYLFLGWICALLFGPQTLALVTLNWEHYTGYSGGFGDSPNGSAHFIAVIVKLAIIFFPVMNVLSSYPLVAVTLGDNLLYLLPESLVPTSKGLGEVSPSLKKSFRLLASVPPVIAAAVVYNLGKILTLTGLFAFFLELTIPAILQLLSIRHMRKKYGYGSETTIFSGWYSDTTIVWTVLVVSSAAFAFGAVNAFQYILSPSTAPTS